LAVVVRLLVLADFAVARSSRAKSGGVADRLPSLTLHCLLVLAEPPD
jgi:hypothetical protein